MKTKHLILLLLPLLSAGCRKYLDAKPDQQQEVPSTQQDLQALLDNVLVMNRFYPNSGEAASDDYYISNDSYNALATPQDKTLYNWQPDGFLTDGQWLSPYQTVFYANEVLGQAGGALKGAALFFRAYAFFTIADHFTLPYDAATAGTTPGIPLRLSADFNERTTRSTLAATYRQILTDLQQAAALLPASSAVPSRPTRSAAFAVLARVCLAMGDFSSAAPYADSCLAAHPALLDFNALNATAANPFTRFNTETIFYAMSAGTSLLNPSRCRVDSDLYASYATNDLRRTVYFKSAAGGYSFKGNYDGVQSSTIFSGPATDEIYLIRAECAARAGKVAQALDLLNRLLVTRWKQGTFQPLTAADGPAALALVLQERRKELVFRGTRWTDIRRLGNITLRRHLNGEDYTLAPGDLREAFLIPQEVISRTGIAQNAR